MSTSSEKGSAAAVENTGSNEFQTPPKTRGQRIKAHLKRFWWAYLIVFCILVLVIVLPIIYVGFPNLAQSQVDDSELTLENQTATFPTPDSVQVVMNTTVRSDSKYHPTLDEFEVELFLEDTLPDPTPFGRLTIPSVKSEGETNILINQEMKIADQEQMARYVAAVVSSDVYRVALRGRTGLKLGKLPKTTVNFNKVVESPGFKNLAGFEVQDIEINLTGFPDGSNMRANISIPNPSVITIDMGRVAMLVNVGSQQIATVNVPELLLTPGDNLIPMTSNANQSAVLELITGDYPDRKLPVTISGVNSTYNDELIPYYTASLKQLRLNTTLDLGPALEAALGGGSD